MPAAKTTSQPAQIDLEDYLKLKPRVGRPPKDGVRAMSTAERIRRCRDRKEDADSALRYEAGLAAVLLWFSHDKEVQERIEAEHGDKLEALEKLLGRSFRKTG